MRVGMAELHSLPENPVVALLFRQRCLLAAACGILASREPLPGVTALAVLWALQPSRSCLRFFLLLCFFGCGAGYAGLRASTDPPEPSWVRSLTAETPFNIPEGLSLSAFPDAPEPVPPRAASIRLRAVVESVAPLYGNRLRMILRDARPVTAGTGTTGSGTAGAVSTPVSGETERDPSGDGSSFPYTGNIVWTWRNPSLYPLPGQEIEGTLRLAPARSMHNPGVWDAGQAWRDRNIHVRAWTNGPGKSGEEVRVMGDAGRMERLRDTLFRRFLAALPGVAPAPVPEGGPREEARGRMLVYEEYTRRFSGTGAALLPALVFGDRSLLSPEQVALVANSTLAHSLSLSGLHLGYVVSLTLGVVVTLGFALPGLWERVPRASLVLPLALLPAAFYVWLGQAPISLLRAMFMLVFWALLVFLGRPRVMLDGLVAAVAVLLLLDPSSLFDLSLQLSAISVAVIALANPFISRLSRRVVSAIRCGPVAVLARGCLSVLLLSAIIQVVILPLTVRAFGTAALCFPLNLVWLPVLGLAVMPLSFAALGCCAAGFSGAARLFLTLATLPCDGLLQSLSWMDAHGWLPAPVTPRPHWLAIAGFWILCLSLPGCFRAFAGNSLPGAAMPGGKSVSRGVRRAVIPACGGILLMTIPLLLFVHARYADRVCLRLLDVAQGQAVLLEWRGGRAMIDGGGLSLDAFDVGKAIVAPILADNAPPDLSLLVNSHPDLDHLGGLLYLFEHSSVERYASNGDRPSGKLGERYAAALANARISPEIWRAGDTVVLSPELSLEVLWPPAGTEAKHAERAVGSEKGNDRSLVLRLVWRGQALAMLCGDVGDDVLRELVKRHAALETQVLVLPHHGSAGSCRPAFYDAVKPRIALVSSGYGNQWGFPSSCTREALLTRGIPLYSTAIRGQIRVEWKTPEHAPGIVWSRSQKR